MPLRMRLSTPAKVNLHLRVGKARDDGFHPLLTWMCTVGLFDIVTVERMPGREIRLQCDSMDVPSDERNVALAAAVCMADALAESREGDASPDSGLRIELLKRIPVGAGLGGGSSDGACILQALNVLWQAGWSAERLAEFASRFGSDLPFFFHAPSAVCRGRGEIVAPTPPPRPRAAVLILPGRAISTAAVYRRFDEMRLGDTAAIEIAPGFDGWARLPAAGLLPLLVNDLEPAAFDLDPPLAELRAIVEQTLGRVVRMSGSGSSLFTLFDEPAEASKAASRVMQTHGTEAIAVDLAVSGPLSATPQRPVW